MRKIGSIAFLIIALSIAAVGEPKIVGTAPLKDSQPTGTTDKKDHKNQQYDLFFVASGKDYTCRTSPKKSMKATDFVVGSDVRYEIDGNKVKLKNTRGKQVECTVVRVAEAAGASQ